MADGFQGYFGNTFTAFQSLSFTAVEAVVVSGTGPNFCGHMLLRVDDYYFHISGVYAYPMFMPAEEYERYLTENSKNEIARVKRVLINKIAARNKLKSILKEKWLWLVVPNNCTDFVEEVIGAGENDFGLISNCPTQLSIKVRQEAERQKMVLTRRGYRKPR